MLFAPLPPITAPLLTHDRKPGGRASSDDPPEAAGLRELLDDIVRAELGAAPLPSGFSTRARDLVVHLIVEGHLPAHLAIEHHDPPAVVERTIAAAWRRLIWNNARQPGGQHRR